MRAWCIGVALGLALSTSAVASDLTQEKANLAAAEALMAQADATSDPVEKLALLDQAGAYLQANDAIERSQRPRWRISPNPVQAPPLSHGQTIYSASECIGAVVDGVCHGSILPNATNHQSCFGSMINGICTGPRF